MEPAETKPNKPWASWALTALTLYLAAHALTGREGLASHLALAEREDALAAEIAALRAQRAALEDEAARLKDGSLDLDLLEERARRLLAARHQNERVAPAGG